LISKPSCLSAEQSITREKLDKRRRRLPSPKSKPRRSCLKSDSKEATENQGQLIGRVRSPASYQGEGQDIKERRIIQTIKSYLKKEMAMGGGEDRGPKGEREIDFRIRGRRG